MRKAFIVNGLKKAVGLDGIRYIGFIGSYARGRGKSGDIDVLLVTDRELDLSKLAELTDRNVAPAVFTVDELEEAPPDFKYSVLRDSLPIYGSLDKLGVAFEVDPKKLLEWIYSDIAYCFYDCLDSLREKNFRYAYRAALKAAIKASWLIFINHGLSLPNNSEEIMDLLDKLTEKKRLYKRVLMDAKSSILGTYDNMFEIFLAEAKINMRDARETIERTLNFVAEVLRTAMSFSSICEDLEHAKRRVREAEATGDIRVLSDACQALFLVIYNSVSFYLTSKGMVPPERHGDRFRELEELSSVYNEARTILTTYRDAFNELHVSHYRRTCSIPLLRKWLTKTEGFLEQLKAWV